MVNIDKIKWCGRNSAAWGHAAFNGLKAGSPDPATPTSDALYKNTRPRSDAKLLNLCHESSEIPTNPD
jgi:hypothetical protein